MPFRDSKRNTRLIIAAALAVLVLAVLWWAVQRPALEVTTAVAKAGPLVIRVITNGTVEPVKDYDVRARFSGRVLSVAHAGTKVDESQVLVRLDAAGVRADLARAQSDRVAAQQRLAQARVDRDAARRRFATDKSLFQQGALTRDVYQQSQAQAAATEARLKSVGHEVSRLVAALTVQIAQLRAQLRTAQTLAPVSGTVYRTYVKVGEVVQPGTPLLRFANLGRLRVRANIDQADLGRVRAGQEVRVSSDAFPGRSWAGGITELIPDVALKTSRAVSEAWVMLHPPVEGLVPGMNVDVEITVSRAEHVLQVPTEAIFSEQGQTVVYRVEDGRAYRRMVRTGRASATDVEVTKGLAAGDTVILGPAEGLYDGAPVVEHRLAERHHEGVGGGGSA